MNATYRYCLTQLLAVAIGALLVSGLVHVGAASAAPLQPTGFSVCGPGVYDQSDMAGIYDEPYMHLEIQPCAVVTVAWVNEYGYHRAMYLTGDPLPGGGIATYGYLPDPQIRAYLDSTNVLLVKPAEPGWIQVASITNLNTIRRVYRLRKTA